MYIHIHTNMYVCTHLFCLVAVYSSCIVLIVTVLFYVFYRVLLISFSFGLASARECFRARQDIAPLRVASYNQ